MEELDINITLGDQITGQRGCRYWRGKQSKTHKTSMVLPGDDMGILLGVSEARFGVVLVVG